MAYNQVVKKNPKDSAGLSPEARIKVYRERAAAQIQPEEQQPIDEYVPSQIEQSEQHLAKLTADVTERVTDIQMAADARKLKAKEELSEENSVRSEMLKNQAESTTEKLSKLKDKWIAPEAKELDLEARDMIKEQHQLYLQIVDEKNNLIQELQQQLKRRLEEFEEGLKREANETDLLIQKMQEEVPSLKKQYNKLLEVINSSLEGEWLDLLKASKAKWEQQSTEQSNREMKLLQCRMKMLEEDADLLGRLKVEMAEERNRIKQKLMVDVHHLQQDLTRLKATNQVNLEKLKYNTEIMKKYMKEYFSTKAQLVRKKNTLTDICKDLKKKIAMHEAENQKKIQLLTNKYRSLAQQRKETKERMMQFGKLNARRYKEIWLMNEDEAKEMVCRALDLDRLIHEHVLGLIWSPPPIPFMDPNHPCAPKLESLNASEVQEYWDSIAHIFPESKLKVWRVLKDGLREYQAELVKKSKLMTETQQLKEQNEELRKLLNIRT